MSARWLFTLTGVVLQVTQLAFNEETAVSIIFNQTTSGSHILPFCFPQLFLEVYLRNSTVIKLNSFTLLDSEANCQQVERNYMSCNVLFPVTGEHITM
jgi:hypothetical protein